MSRGLLIVLSGPSGTGKGTVCKCLFRTNNNLKLSISMTTRLPRPGEIDGVDYYFTSTKKFESLINKGAFLEWAKVYGNYYGTPCKGVLRDLNMGYDVILEIDVQGGLQVRYNKDIKAVFIFLLPPSVKVLRERIISRATESSDKIRERLEAAYKEVAAVYNYDYIVLNDKVEKAAEKIKSIITAEKCKVSKSKAILNNLIEGGSIHDLPFY